MARTNKVSALPAAARINARAASRLRNGHLWVYKSDIDNLPQASAGLVEVLGPKGRTLGWALYSPASMITLRMFSGFGETRSPRELTRVRLAQALERRQRSVPLQDAFRWVHGEADLLPGIFVDRYDDVVTLQTTCAGAEALEPWLVEDILEIFSPRALVLRNDAAPRRKEGLKQYVQLLHGTEPVQATYHEGEVAFDVDLLAGQKTGGFLDQSTNHVLAGTYAFGEGLDCCTYHGGFALQLARRCTNVVACDVSAEALTQAKHNAERAGADNIMFVRGDVFDTLRRYHEQERLFDIIVLDPPAFASTQKTVPQALAAYQDMNATAMQLLRPNGILVSCSCSGRVSPAEFDEVLQAAAKKAGRFVQLLERRGAGLDHPVLLGMPETEYLKCRMMVVL